MTSGLLFRYFLVNILHKDVLLVTFQFCRNTLNFCPRRRWLKQSLCVRRMSDATCIFIHLLIHTGKNKTVFFIFYAHINYFCFRVCLLIIIRIMIIIIIISKCYVSKIKMVTFFSN